jgi:hypothetical protein
MLFSRAGAVYRQLKIEFIFLMRSLKNLKELVGIVHAEADPGALGNAASGHDFHLWSRHFQSPLSTGAGKKLRLAF